MNSLEEILSQQSDVRVIDTSIPYTDYVPLDLSVNSNELKNHKPQTADEYEAFITNYLSKNQGKVAYGGYMEKRNLYQRSSIFNSLDTSSERNIHIGLDLWIKAGTSVLAALDGVIHSFQNNNALGDYGPTIIIKHTLKNCEFYTLYGHLSLESLALLKINQPLKKGDKIATLGNANVNGDYAAHLHFQIINNIGEYQGDYPGVCSEKDLDFYKNNCPNPNLLLKI
ncbi:MAG TPA: peptidoglycan DD-metalloendopeptidase family protein [Flavobacterium sp.]|uniref:peptidoglycan DD-metalloendopeptidase family protein n=1 Tax=unclassified Flavobacterium TaxID=196869 RepID=UPI000E9208C0|nr:MULTISPECIES: peptidoglycan DD-metalloendopeptidase family protein [unclassified Flavobacterium]HBI00587.1 peptidase M23 [Flavobacterium sp.]HRE78133.1 peptidoglycan DD-metalloendopeptidase family protein [Flavobacterium sp.]